MKLYHNRNCSKSRALLAALTERGIPFDVIDYLATPLTRPELEELLIKLGLQPRDLIRAAEPEFAASGLGLDADPAQLVELLANEPRLLQRPILEIEGRARIGRPPERALELLD